MALANKNIDREVNMLKTKPSEEQMELVKDIAKKIRELAKKEGEMEICALIPFFLIEVLIKVSEKHKGWDLLILLADLISQLSILIDKIDIPLEELEK